MKLESTLLWPPWPSTSLPGSGIPSSVPLSKPFRYRMADGTMDQGPFRADAAAEPEPGRGDPAAGAMVVPAILIAGLWLST